MSARSALDVQREYTVGPVTADNNLSLEKDYSKIPFLLRKLIN